MRILMLAQNYAPIVGGEERMVEDLSMELVRRGHEVAVATIRPPGTEAHGGDDGVRIHNVRSSVYKGRRLHRGTDRPQAPPAPDPLSVVDLRRVLHLERPDVVHAHNWLVHSYLPLAHRSDAPLLLSLHDYGLLCATKRLLHRGVDCGGPGPVKCVQCAAHHYHGAKGAAIALGVLARGPMLRRRVDLFLPVSRAVRDRCGLGPGDAHRVIPDFLRETGARVPTDARLTQLPREPFVLFLGDVAPDKGARHLAEVYATLDQPPPLVMIGRCFVPELAQDPNVKLLGSWPHDLGQEALRRCLLVVVPTIMAEAFGLAALEGAAAGRAVIASAAGGLPEVVIHEQTGLLVAPGDRASLRAALHRLILDGPLRARLGAAGARHAASFTAAAVVPAFEDAYETAKEAPHAHRTAA